MPPTATLRVTGKRAAMPEATVSLLKSELPRSPCERGPEPVPVLGEEPLVEVQLVR